MSEALEGRRDLEVEFVALKRNFISLQKECKQLKEDNQSLSLDVVNLGNDNERLRKDWAQKGGLGNDRSRAMLELQGEREEELRKEVRRH